MTLPLPPVSPMTPINRETFEQLAKQGNVIALSRRLMSDQLTPVLAYRRLVSADERTAPSFLFESVEGGANVGQHSFLGAQPCLEVVAKGHQVTVIDHRAGESTTTEEADPLSVPKRITESWKIVRPEGSPIDLPCSGGFSGGSGRAIVGRCFIHGWA